MLQVKDSCITNKQVDLAQYAQNDGVEPFLQVHVFIVSYLFKKNTGTCFMLIQYI